MTQVRAKGAEIIARARAEHRHIIVLAGRPYMWIRRSTMALIS